MIAHDLEFALQTMVNRKSEINEWRKLQVGRLIDLCNEANGIDEVLESMRSSNSRLVASHVNLGRNLVAAESIGWPDRTVSEMMASGARPLGIPSPVMLAFHPFAIPPLGPPRHPFPL